MTEKMLASQMRILAPIGAVHLFGAERANLEVLESLRDQGASVMLIVRNADYSKEFRDFVASRGLESRAAHYLETPKPYNKTMPWIDLPVGILRGSAAFLKIHREFKPTHIHSYSQLWVLNFLLGIALVGTPMVYRSGDAPTLHNAVWRAVWRFIIGRTTRFGAISRFLIDEMGKAGVTSDRITLIYSRPPRRSVTLKAASASRKQKKTFNIGYMGQVTRLKGVGLLVEAFERVVGDFPDARLLIAGHIHEDWDGEPWGKALKYATLAKPAIAERIEFAGFVENIPEFLTRCDVTVVPTLTEEPMGNVAMEAKQAGLPSIIFRSGGLKELIEHGVTGYTCPEKTVDALEAGLRFYLANRTEAKRQGLAAKASLTALGVDDFAERWLKLYQEVVR